MGSRMVNIVPVVGVPVTEESALVCGVVKTLAGNVQGNAANLGKKHSQGNREHNDAFLAEHGEIRAGTGKPVASRSA